MFRLRRTLFPVDFSARCRGAAAYVEGSALEDLLETEMEHFDKFFGSGLKHLRAKKLVEHGDQHKGLSNAPRPITPISL